jgi:ATP-dependent RNA helicase SUPV3L1/SUV3
VVLGALSPRTRNAQVALYQAGEVDYLVATDAIGMGLNMDLDHVAFARLASSTAAAAALTARPRSARSPGAPGAT